MGKTRLTKTNKCLVILLIIMLISLLAGCGDSSSSSGTSSSGTSKGEDSRYPDGIASGYDRSDSSMMDPSEVYDYYHDYGFDYVYLEEHEMSHGDSDNVSDLITLLATYVNPDGLWSVTKEIQTIYSYISFLDQWDNRWVDAKVTDFSCDGFNGTYWKILADNKQRYELAIALLGKDAGMLGNGQIDIYIYLDGFENAKGMDESVSTTKIALNNIHPRIDIVVDTDISQFDTSASLKGGHFALNKRGYSYFELKDVNHSNSTVNIYQRAGKTTESSVDEERAFIVPITEEEYNSVIQSGADKKVIPKENDEDETEAIEESQDATITESDKDTETPENNKNTKSTQGDETEIINDDISDRLDKVDIFGIGIDGMRSILCNSELSIMSEETANALDDNEVIDLYEELTEHENDGGWFIEKRKLYGLIQEDSDYILPESDRRYYSADELSDLSKDDLRIARNEIYARRGRIFDSADLDEYFRSKSWYNPTTTAAQFSEDILNDYEKKNAELIKSVEDEK